MSSEFKRQRSTVSELSPPTHTHTRGGVIYLVCFMGVVKTLNYKTDVIFGGDSVAEAVKTLRRS